MRRSLSAFVIALCCALVCGAQNPTSSDTTSTGVVLVNLSRPAYPPLARAARISGDVVLNVHIRSDGSVESVEVISGHPMLKPTALDSANQSHFECSGCIEPITSFELVYTFKLGDSYCPSDSDKQVEVKFLSVTQIQNHVTIFDRPIAMCDPTAQFTGIRIRSAKCLYLWKCSTRYSM